MPITVKPDVMQGAQIQQDGNALSRTRIFYVCGISSSNGGSAVLPLALAAAGVPLVGDADPDISGLYARQRRVVPGVGDDDATVMVTYRSPDGTFGSQAQVEVGTTTSQVLTGQDASGAPITISYTNGAGVAFPVLPAKAPTLRARSTYVVVRVESAEPSAKSRQYSGYANATSWKGCDAHTWRCLGIVGRSTDGGVTYIVTYSFEYNPDSWSEAVTYPDVALTADDIANGNGYAKVETLPEAEFNDLGI